MPRPRAFSALLALGLALTPLGCLDSKRPPGDKTRFDPIAAYSEVAAYAGPSMRLVEMEAVGVRKDGTIDLTDRSFSPEVEYRFQREVSPPKDAPPVGAGGGDQWILTVAITVERPGKTWHEKSTYYDGTRRTRGMMREESGPYARPIEDALPAPTCSFAEMWAVGIDRGAPPDAVATIEYDEGRYKWSIQGTQLELEFDTDCKLIMG